VSGFDNKPNYFLFEASKVARYAVPFLKNIDKLISVECKMPEDLMPTSGLIRLGRDEPVSEFTKTEER
jgi:hypothetical protein